MRQNFHILYVCLLFHKHMNLQQVTLRYWFGLVYGA